MTAAARPPNRGFSLIEVLVALAVLGIGLGALTRSGTVGVRTAEDLWLRVLAAGIAEDRLHELELGLRPRPQSPETGVVMAARRSFHWKLERSGAGTGVTVAVWSGDPNRLLARLEAGAE
jgi:general secretion pathway protein I